MEALKNLEVWRRGCRLCVCLYGELENCRHYGYREQLTSAALSIPSNIAEGYERDSPREFARFLRIAKGSCGEVWTQLRIGIEAGFIDAEAGRKFEQEVREIASMLHGLIKRCTDLPVQRLDTSH